MSRWAILCAVALCVCGTSRSDDDVKAFVQARKDKRLEQMRKQFLDPKISDKDFKACHYFFTNELKEEVQRSMKPYNKKWGMSLYKAICDAAVLYEKRDAKRFEKCRASVVDVAVSEREFFLAAVPQPFIDYYVKNLDALMAKTGPRSTLFFIQLTGPRAKAAIPRLESLRDGENDGVAVLAFQALKAIKGK